LKYLFFVLILLLEISSSSCSQTLLPEKRLEEQNHWFTSCESTKLINKVRFFSDGKGLIKSQNIICDSISRSGKFSLIMKQNKKFAFETSIKKIKKGDYFLASVWVKGSISLPKLTAVYNKRFNTKNKVLKKENGWSYLEIRIHIKEDAPELKFYVFKPDKIQMILDDFHVYKLPNKMNSKTNQLEGIEKVNLKVPEDNLIKVIEQRKQAFNDKMLSKKTKKWIKVEANGKKAKMRLKGDWLDHLSNYKWSYRIKTTQPPFVEYSITNPISRNFLIEFSAQKIMRSEGIFTTNYSFCYVSTNDSMKGIYGLEQHFNKKLIETWKFGSGDILKYDENDVWKIRKKNNLKDRQELNYLDCSNILSYINKGNSEHMKNNGKTLDILKKTDFPVDSIFDIDYMAKYCALIDLFNAHHGIFWHNIRLFKSDSTHKYYPIAFDLSTDKNSNNDDLLFQKIDKEPIFIGLFQNKKFKKKYFNQLKIYSSDDFLNRINTFLGEEHKLYSKAILQEYDSVWIQNELYRERAQQIKLLIQNGLKDTLNTLKFDTKNTNLLNNEYEFEPVISAKAYNQGNGKILIMNFYNKPIEIISFEDDKGRPVKTSSKQIQAYKKAFSKAPYYIHSTKTKLKWCVVSVNKKRYRIKIRKGAYPISY